MGQINDKTSASLDTDTDATDIMSLFHSLSIGGDAHDDDMSVMTSGASEYVDDAKVLTTMPQSLDVAGSSLESIGGDAHDGDMSVMTFDASEYVDDANDLTTTPQSLYVAGSSLERHHVLETKHKIFLSHSGAQKSFVADLCADLMRRDRYPFFDRSRSSLPVGEKFPNLIFDAIGQCEVGVVVLSEQFFTRSKWPMLELVAMVEESKKPNSRIKIIPVFYSISRNKCRDPTVQDKWMIDCWMEWMEWSQQDKGRIDLGKWKSALGVFGSITGLEMKDGMLDGELRAEIVEAICKHVRPEMRWDDSKVAGKTRLCQEIYKMVYKGFQPKNWKGGVQMVGLYGMGGIGKTTACKILCNELSQNYCDRVCHVEFGSTKESIESELASLKKVLGVLSDLDDRIMVTISDVGLGHWYLKTRIIKERVLLALDNVSDNSKNQAKSYLETKFGDGSMVLVTARSMDQLLGLGVKKDCFAMPELELEEAKSLFLSHTGMEKNEVDQVLMKECVKRCCFRTGQSSSSDDNKQYHPLALKVLGSEVGDLIRQHDVARQAVLIIRISSFNLSRQKEHPVFSILRSSFDSLLEEDQLLFLLVAIFLPTRGNFNCIKWLGLVDGRKGNDIEWRLECLKRRSLLESFGKRDNDFRMHDLWREFAAAEIESGKWKEQLFLSNGCKRYGRKVDLTGFPKMRVVKLTEVGDEVLDVWGLKQLRSLEVSNMWFNFESVINGLRTLEDLTYLRCERVASCACIAELGWLTNLQVVELERFKAEKLPDMSKLTNLRHLNLRYSMFLQTIELQNLLNLTYLDIDGCMSLQSVDISGCRSITDILYLSVSSSTLEELNVSSCPLLPSVPGLVYLRKLRKLDITGCTSIKQLDDLRWFLSRRSFEPRNVTV